MLKSENSRVMFVDANNDHGESVMRIDNLACTIFCPEDKPL